MKITKKHTVFLSSIILGFLFLLSSVPAFAAGVNTWTTKAAMANARQYHQVVVVDGKIYAIGGMGGGGYINSVEQYDPTTNIWTTKTSIPTARGYHQAAVVGGKIYVMGGQNGIGNLTSVEVYDPAKNSWTAKTSMPTSILSSQVVVLGEKIYVIGGLDNKGYLNSVEEYDPVTDKWTTKAAMSTARGYHQVEVVGGKIYAVGGRNSDGYLNSVEEYDPVTDTWNTKALMPTARGYHQVGVVSGKIYAIGGQNGNGYLNSVEEYDPTTNKWASKAAMLTTRKDYQIAIVGEKIYVIGGNNGSYINKVEGYDPATNTWTAKAVAPTVGDYPIAVVGGNIYTIGGGSASSYINSVNEYSTEYSSLVSPTGLTAKVDNVKINLSWTAVDGAASYSIKRATKAGGPYTLITTGTDTTYTDTNVTNGTTYYYVVSALNTAGESLNSDEASATPIDPNKVTLEVTSVDKAKLGDEITANIVIHNTTNICAEDLKIAYDTSKLQFISAENADGMKIYKEDDIAAGIKRYITACLGKANAANGDKILLKMKFQAIDKGEAKIDIINGRIADNATLEMDVDQINCGEKTVLIEGTKDVNRTGEYTLLDLGIDAWYYGSAVADTDTSKYDADQKVNGTIDDDDLNEIVTQILNNTNYTANK